MKAIPTRYKGMMFRSRLEARWAAFFDELELSWEYEPMDLEGWTPDFGLSTSSGDYVLVEIKPVPPKSQTDMPATLLEWRGHGFEKAVNHTKDWWVMLCGISPNEPADFFGIGVLLDKTGSTDGEDFGRWYKVKDAISEKATPEAWRRACSKVQWRGSDARA